MPGVSFDGDHDKIKSAMKRAIVKTLGHDDRELCSELVTCMEKNMSESKITYSLNKYLNRRDAESLTSRAIRYFEDLQREKFELKGDKRSHSERKRGPPREEKRGSHKEESGSLREEIGKSNEKQRLSDLQESVQQRLAALKASISHRMEDHSKGLILDESGRVVNKATGQDVEVRRNLPTLQANNRNARAPPKAEKFHDPRIKIRSMERSRRPLKLNNPGLFIQRARVQQSKHQLSVLQREIARAARRTGIDSVSRIVSVQPENNYLIDHIPDIEWWDSLLIASRSYGPALGAIEGEDLSGEFGSVGRLIEHPKKLVLAASAESRRGIVVPLTKGERRKIRRQQRLEAQKEFQEKIRLGLVSPPEPKVRMANLMRVLGSEAVQDPTKVEAHVRSQMSKRKRAHEKANAERRLTTEQAREKVLRKVWEDTSSGVHVLLFRVSNLSSASHRFKVETNCRQLLMTGFVALLADCNVIVVEGGPKQTRKFRQLMMRRIRWDKVKRAAEEGENSCTLVWSGVVEKRAFSDLKFKNCPTATFAREQFRKFGVENYWDLCYCSAVLQQGDS